MAEKRDSVKSIETLQGDAVSIMETIHADQDLARAALSNPILALEAIGYEIDPALRPALERRMRFPADTAARLEELERKVHEAAGRPFDLGDDDALGAVLDDLEVSRHAIDEAPDQPARTVQQTPAGRVHPIVAPLLEYRRLDATRPPLASREVFEGLRTKRIGTGLAITRVQVRFHTDG